jgi:hypothetical protein
LSFLFSVPDRGTSANADEADRARTPRSFDDLRHRNV